MRQDMSHNIQAKLKFFVESECVNTLMRIFVDIYTFVIFHLYLIRSTIAHMFRIFLSYDCGRALEIQIRCVWHTIKANSNIFRARYDFSDYLHTIEHMIHSLLRKVPNVIFVLAIQF